MEKYDRYGVERGIILPATNPECGHRIQSIEEAMEICEKYPRFSFFANIDPRMGANDGSTHFGKLLEYYRARGALGVGEICANIRFDDPRITALFAACEKNRMPVIFHIGPYKGGCYGLIDELGLPSLERSLILFPNLIFLGHSQPFWAEISSDITERSRNEYPEGPVRPGRLVELFSLYKNLWGDLSAGSAFNAITRDEKFGLAFLHEFADRLCFGQDICRPDQEHPLAAWLDKMVVEGKLSTHAYMSICRNNTRALFGL